MFSWRESTFHWWCVPLFKFLKGRFFAKGGQLPYIHPQFALCKKLDILQTIVAHICIFIWVCMIFCKSLKTRDVCGTGKPNCQILGSWKYQLKKSQKLIKEKIILKIVLITLKGKEKGSIALYYISLLIGFGKYRWSNKKSKYKQHL